MKITVEWGKPPGKRALDKLAQVIVEKEKPENEKEKATIIRYGLQLISEAMQEAEEALVRYGCRGSKYALEQVIKGNLPEVQQELLEDLTGALKDAMRFSKLEGGIDLDGFEIYEIPLEDGTKAKFTVGDLLRHGAEQIFTPTPEERLYCKQLEKDAKRFRTFLQHVTSLNIPNFPYVDTSTVPYNELLSLAEEAFYTLYLAGIKEPWELYSEEFKKAKKPALKENPPNFPWPL